MPSETDRQRAIRVAKAFVAACNRGEGSADDLAAVIEAELAAAIEAELSAVRREAERRWKSPELLERLAAWDHQAWAGWMRYLWTRLITRGDGLLIPANWAERWQRQMNTAYADLSDAEKESDRAEARQIIAVIAASEERP